MFSKDLYRKHIKNQGLFGKGLRRVTVSEHRSPEAGGLLIQVVSNTGVTVFHILTFSESLNLMKLTLSQTSPGFYVSAVQVF